MVPSLYAKHRDYIQRRIGACRTGKDWQKFNRLLADHGLVIVGGLDGGEALHTVTTWVAKAGYTPISVDITLDVGDWESELMGQAGTVARSCLIIDHPLEYHTSLIVKIAKVVHRTVVLVDDTFSPEVRGLSAAAKQATVNMYDLPPRCVHDILTYVARQEKLVLVGDFMSQIASDAGGNIAGAINRLQFEAIIGGGDGGSGSSGGNGGNGGNIQRNWNLFSLGKEILTHGAGGVGPYRVEEPALNRFLFANYNHTVAIRVPEARQMDVLSQVADLYAAADILEAAWPPNSITTGSAEHIMHQALNTTCRQGLYYNRRFWENTLVENLKQVNLCDRGLRAPKTPPVYIRSLNADRVPILVRGATAIDEQLSQADWYYEPLGNDARASVITYLVRALHQTNPSFARSDSMASKLMAYDDGVEPASVLAVMMARRFPDADILAAPWWPSAWAAMYQYIDHQLSRQSGAKPKLDIYRACIDLINEASDLLNTMSDLQQALQDREVPLATLYLLVCNAV